MRMTLIDNFESKVLRFLPPHDSNTGKSEEFLQDTFVPLLIFSVAKLEVENVGK